MNKSILLLLLLFIVLFSEEKTIYAQWKEKPEVSALSKEEQKEAFIYIFSKDSVSFKYTKEQHIQQTESRHYKVHISNKQSLDYHSQIYIPVQNTVKVLELKARSITPSGKIIEFNRDNIKEVENIDDQGQYKIFAIKDVKINCDIEVYYKKQVVPKFANYTVLHQPGLVKDVSFTLTSPPDIYFKAKAYNTKDTIKNTITSSQRILSLSIDSLPTIKDEKYAAYNRQLARIHYHLEKHEDIRENPYTYSRAAKNFKTEIYEIKKRKDKRKLTKAIKKSKIPRSKQTERMIKNIEHYLKNTFSLKEEIHDNQNIATILNNQTTDEYGLTRLFCHYLEHFEIKHELVLTCNRYKFELDPDFFSWYYLNEYLIYFPGLDQYICPGAIHYRYPLTPYPLTSNYGLFIKSPCYSEDNGYQIKKIPATPAEISYSNMDITIHNIEPAGKMELSIDEYIGGHSAMHLLPYYHFSDQNQREQLIKEFLKSISEDINIDHYEVQNHSIDTAPVKKPFKIHAKGSISSLIESDGNDYHLKIGKVIGQQIKMHNKKEEQRELPIEINYPHHLNRDIRFIIPEGFTIKGLDKLRYNLSYGPEKVPDIGFVSSYKQEKDTIHIQINEFYNKQQYAKERYPEFKKITNAAADFNQLQLLLKNK
ncbi:MAG: DUF3857 domain-containing protein [Bacteroidota bacterium]